MRPPERVAELLTASVSAQERARLPVVLAESVAVTVREHVLALAPPRTAPVDTMTLRAGERAAAPERVAESLIDTVRAHERARDATPRAAASVMSTVSAAVR